MSTGTDDKPDDRPLHVIADELASTVPQEEWDRLEALEAWEHIEPLIDAFKGRASPIAGGVDDFTPFCKLVRHFINDDTVGEDAEAHALSLWLNKGS